MQMSEQGDWDEERRALLGRKISELGLTIRGSRVEHLVNQLYAELAEKSVAYRPPVYLSDEWGCPDGTLLVGVPFYLVDERLGRTEAHMAGTVGTGAASTRCL